ncbi:MAG: hypothetical protein KDJ14_16545 [Xanthomonadales bacterium]|nr:hypothetical protein [Xanthomonadales bacterium]
MVRHFATLLIALGLLAGPAAHASCSRVLVSGYYTSVHVYDGCDGTFLRLVDSRTRITGAQAVRQRGDLLYIVAEGHNSIQRYRADTFEFVDTFISVGGNPGITGVTFGPDGDVYLGGYNSGTVLRFDGTTGAPKGEVVSRSGTLGGPDNGLVFGPDGKLYIPGYDTNNVVRWNPATGQTDVFIPGGRGGLRHTRNILFEPDGTGVLVSSEGSGQILRFNLDGSFDKALTSFGYGPNGMDYDSDGTLLVTGFGGDLVERLDAKSGARLGIVVSARAGGLSGATFLTVLPGTAPVVDQAQVGTQYWLTGAGMPDSRTLDLELLSSHGTTFGDAFDPTEVVDRRWGDLNITFTGCDSAQMSWQSSAEDTAGFGDGGYPLQRIATTAASARCNAEGVDAQDSNDWMAGSWYGGPGRSGEGFFLDALANGVVVVAFFTHRPAPAAP